MVACSGTRGAGARCGSGEDVSRGSSLRHDADVRNARASRREDRGRADRGDRRRKHSSHRRPRNLLGPSPS
eukprot:565985-Rhodomonas_salina.3